MIVTNVSNATVTIGHVSIRVTQGDSSDFILEQGGCVVLEGMKLKAGKTCKIGVIFHPDAASTDTATLNIPSTAAGSPLEVSLTGTGEIKK